MIAACPLQAGPIFTTFKDLSLCGFFQRVDVTKLTDVAIEWKDLCVLELPGTGWCAIVGHKRQEDLLRAVVPLPLHTSSLKPSNLKSIFSALSTLTQSDLPQPIPALIPDITSLRRDLATRRGHDPPPVTETESETVPTNQDIDKEMIYMGIVTSDSTVVYYKLTKGIKKPADIPDE